MEGITAVEIRVGDVVCEEVGEELEISDKKIGAGSFPGIVLRSSGGRTIECRPGKVFGLISRAPRPGTFDPVDDLDPAELTCND